MGTDHIAICYQQDLIRVVDCERWELSVVHGENGEIRNRFVFHSFWIVCCVYSSLRDLSTLKAKDELYLEN